MPGEAVDDLAFEKVGCQQESRQRIHNSDGHDND
jgi:hypothetical protein